MKTIVISLILCVGIISCNHKATNSAPEAQDTVLAFDETISHGVIAMNTFHITDTVTFGGHVYCYDILRVADSMLANVVDAETQKVYMDNRVELKIMRDGADFYSKTFTKSDFKSYLDEGFSANGLLEGFVFDDVAEDGLRFATSVSYPQSDMYIPMSVTIKSDRSMVVTKDNMMDSTPEED